MSVQAALLFLRDAREDEALRAELKRRRLALDLPLLCDMGAARGWRFDEAQLREAFGIEWRLRRARATPKPGIAPPLPPGPPRTR